MAVTALLFLEDVGALPLKRSTVFEKFGRDHGTAPRIHLRAPRRVSAQLREDRPADSEEHHREDSDGTAPPALFADASDEGQTDESRDGDGRNDEEERGLKFRRKEGENRIDP